MIKAKDPRLHRITIVEHDFLLSEGSFAQGGVTLVDSSSSHQAAETEEVKQKVKSKFLNWASPRTNSVHSTKSICPRIHLVIWVTPA